VFAFRDSREKKKGGAPILGSESFIKQRRAHAAASGVMRRIRRMRRAG
jgi:hypothetical protein